MKTFLAVVGAVVIGSVIILGVILATYAYWAHRRAIPYADEMQEQV